MARRSITPTRGEPLLQTKHGAPGLGDPPGRRIVVRRGEMIGALKIIGLAVIAAVVYGILHDQVTTRICIEYFTVGHPPVFATHNATLLAIGWGSIATWWVGLVLGVPLAIAARAGQRPRRDAVSLIRPVLLLLTVTGACATLAGAAAWMLVRLGVVTVPRWIAMVLPPAKQLRFLVDLWVHTASYWAGFAGGLVLIPYVWNSRTDADERETAAPIIGGEQSLHAYRTRPFQATPQSGAPDRQRSARTESD